MKLKKIETKIIENPYVHIYVLWKKHLLILIK